MKENSQSTNIRSIFTLLRPLMRPNTHRGFDRILTLWRIQSRQVREQRLIFATWVRLVGCIFTYRSKDDQIVIWGHVGGVRERDSIAFVPFGGKPFGG